MRSRIGVIAAVVAVVGGAFVAAPGRAAAFITVDTTADAIDTNGDCSLREAVRAANLNQAVDTCSAGASDTTDVISIPAGTYTLTIAGQLEQAALTGDLDITQAVHFTGAGPGQTIVEAGTTGGADGNGIDRVFDIIGGTYPVTFQEMGIRNGKTPTTGGGILRPTFGPLTLDHVSLTDNFAATNGGGMYLNSQLFVGNTTIMNNAATGDGGGFYNPAPVTMQYSTVANNVAGGSGGGMFVNIFQPTNVTISGNEAGGNGGGVATFDLNSVNSTIADNKADADGEGGGIGGGVFGRSDGGSKLFKNTILAGNLAGTSPDQCGGGLFQSQGGTWIDNIGSCNFPNGNVTDNGDPHLLPLADYGGFTKTRALSIDSGAVDAGVADGCAEEDQREVERPTDGPDGDRTPECDIGAYELLMHPRELDLELRGHLSAKARVIVPDGYAKCRSGQRVAIEKRVGDAWEEKAHGKTGADGRVAIELPDRPGRYRATVANRQLGPKGHGDVCRAARSPAIEHEH